MERIQEQIVESIKEDPQERVQRTVEQNVCVCQCVPTANVRAGKTRGSGVERIPEPHELVDGSKSSKKKILNRAR